MGNFTGSTEQQLPLGFLVEPTTFYYLNIGDKNESTELTCGALVITDFHFYSSSIASSTLSPNTQITMPIPCVSPCLGTKDKRLNFVQNKQKHLTNNYHTSNL
ncbi:hypothetical protein VCR31J2_1310556 [Vibrio coralliirubri]|uniref:Uncharacterized protein n=1 Tax=Vibrio coralliirubri TaxID=1516159 RepID=A0AA87C0J6_9VIBR|nr:hypothetical protein VCR31J2_1310556 [Vibrio coralliirubri]